MIQKRKENGFTLIEMLLAAAIALIGLSASTAILMQVYKNSHLLETADQVQQQTNIALEKVVRECQETAVDNVDADPNSISFPSARDDNGNFLLDGNGKPVWTYAIVYIKEPLLFSVSLGFQSDLDNCYISDELRQEFEDNDTPLSKNAIVLVGEIGSQWLYLIDDRSNGRTYSVKNESAKLNIYALNTLYRYKYDWATYNGFDPNSYESRELIATSVTGLEFWFSGNNFLNIKMTIARDPEEAKRKALNPEAREPTTDEFITAVVIRN